jgi:LPS sulfotransferase NodH
MSKRLQVILQDPEYREIQRVARSRHMTIAEWVRQALDLARRREPTGSMAKKLEAVRRAAQCQYPAGDIDSMLGEIEAGYTAGLRP